MDSYKRACCEDLRCDALNAGCTEDAKQCYPRAKSFVKIQPGRQNLRNCSNFKAKLIHFMLVLLFLKIIALRNLIFTLMYKFGRLTIYDSYAFICLEK